MAEALPPNPGEMRFGKMDDIKARVAAAIDASRKYLFSLQHPEEGYWSGELGADTTLESDYILLHRLLGTEDAEAHAEVCQRNPVAPEPRRWMADLQRRPVQHQRVGEGVLCLEDGGLRP